MKSANRIFFQSFRKYWYLVALTILLSLFAAMAEVFSIGMLIPFLQNLSAETTGTFRTGVGWIDRYMLGAGASQIERMYRICAIILAATWLRSLFGYFSAFYGMKSRALVVEDLRMRIVEQLRNVSLFFFSQRRPGALINSLTNELQRVSQSLNVVVTVITQSFMLLAYSAFLVWVSWKLSLLVLVFFGLLSLALTRLIASIRHSGKRITRANSRFTSMVSEFIGGIRTVTAFNMQAFEEARLRQATTQLADAIIETNRRSQIVQPFSQAVVSTVLIGVIIIAVQYYVLPGQIDMAFLLAFLFALFRMMPVVHQLNNQRGQWANLRAAVFNVAGLLTRHDKPYLPDGTRTLEAFEEAITFENVSFAYEPGSEHVLKHISLRIERGKTTAIVGASGAGKSTLVDLIPRFYDPTEGRILLDGMDLRTFEVASLRDKIAVVSQDTFIFNDTVHANIAYGAPDTPPEQIVDAARKANALEFIEEMAEGFDTVLGDRGVRLSGGQRQRVAIARALVRDPDILILDEATSALDSVSERLVQQSLERLMTGRTVIAIAHRLSTIEHADWVVVLEDGRIVEQGPYDELLAREGQLWHYHSIQYQRA